MKVSYLPYKEIDKTKWDRCVNDSANRLIYAFSFYLDNMSANWDGLVLNDYEAVMPLTWRKKLRVKYLYQPAFMQQGGIFSQLKITSGITKHFLDAAAAQFNFAEITLNYANDLLGSDKIKLERRMNHVLILSSYETVFANYDAAFTKSLRRIKKFNIRYEKSEDYTSVIQLYKKLYGKRQPSFRIDDYKNLLLICSHLAKENNVITRMAYGAENELLSAVVLLKDGKRVYNLVSCITVEGKKLESNYFLYDKIAQELSGHGLLLDLEGSDVKGIANFYKKLSPVMQPYSFIKYNQLHPLLKVFKK